MIEYCFIIMKSYYRRIYCVWLAILCTFSPASFGQIPVAADIDLLKIAYIYNFSRYFTWPSTAKWQDSTSLNICIQNNDFAFGSFSSLSEKISQGKDIQIITLENNDVNIKETCHIWFIDTDSFLDLGTQLENPGKDGVLTIIDYQGHTDLGGVIELVAVDNRVKFKINIAIAKAKGLKASSLLLELGIADE